MNDEATIGVADTLISSIFEMLYSIQGDKTTEFVSKEAFDNAIALSIDEFHNNPSHRDKLAFTYDEINEGFDIFTLYLLQKYGRITINGEEALSAGILEENVSCDNDGCRGLFVKVKKRKYKGKYRLTARIFHIYLVFYEDMGASTSFDRKKKFLWWTYWKNTNASLGVKAIFVKNEKGYEGGDYSGVLFSQKRTQYDNYVSSRVFSIGIYIDEAPIGRDLINPDKYHFNINFKDLFKKEEWEDYRKVKNTLLPFDIKGWTHLEMDGVIGVHKGEKSGTQFYLETRWKVKDRVVSAETGKPYIIQW